MQLFTKAKTRSLVDFAQKSGFTLRKQGSGYAAKHCPCCSPGSNDALSIFPKDGVWRWNCFRCKRGGTVIDFAAAVWGMSEMEAAMRLANEGEIAQAILPPPAPSIPALDETLKAALESLLKHGHTSVPGCVNYLTSRGISERVITQAVRRGLLRFLPADPFHANKMLHERLGAATLRQSGLLKLDSRWPGIAFRPLVFFFPGCGAAEFRLARPPKDGEPKAIRYGTVRWPWWWKEGNAVSTIYIVEGVIDLLSFVELGLKEGEAVIGIPGTASWRAEWFAAAKKAHPAAKFVVALDADDPGQEAANGLRETLSGMGAQVVERIPRGHDWNEHLLAARAAA